MTRAHLESAADRGGELEPVEEAAAAPHTGAVVGVAVGGVAAHVSSLVWIIMIIIIMIGVAVGGVAAHVSSLVRIIMVSFTPDPDLTVSRAPGAVTGALDPRPDQGEAVRVHNGVDGLEAGVGHLNVSRHRPLGVLRPEPVT